MIHTRTLTRRSSQQADSGRAYLEPSATVNALSRRTKNLLIKRDGLLWFGHVQQDVIQTRRLKYRLLLHRDGFGRKIRSTDQAPAVLRGKLQPNPIGIGYTRIASARIVLIRNGARLQE